MSTARSCTSPPAAASSARGARRRSGSTPGDTVWVPPGEVHWHGGAPGSYLLHLAVSLGTTSWLEPVGDGEYSAAGDAP